MNAKLRQVVTALRRGYEELYGDRLVRLMLFGSQARDDAEPGSDVDVLVVLNGTVDAYEEIQRTSEFVGNLCLEHSVVIASVFISEDEFLHKQSPLLRNVRREGVPV
jgi:predicted nucleotidyltransferase